MADSSSGSSAGQGPDLTFPMWILVAESDLWKLGLTASIRDFRNENLCGGAPCLLLFNEYPDALKFINSASAMDTRPLPIDDPVVFLAILNFTIRTGVTHVAHHAPDLPGTPFLAGDANELSARLAAPGLLETATP